ncbi:MAG: PAS domain S-box protein [Cytophagales bacterium]|nr:PAS domain S-box protein [Bernardetiaceae bacterium]MDW8210045.1 PAS domain S-box protein [Cytophagales bacterium]
MTDATPDKNSRPLLEEIEQLKNQLKELESKLQSQLPQQEDLFREQIAQLHGAVTDLENLSKAKETFGNLQLLNREKKEVTDKGVQLPQMSFELVQENSENGHGTHAHQQNSFSSSALPAQGELYQAIFENHPQPIVLLENSGRILSINRAAMQLLQKKSSKEIVGELLGEILPLSVSGKEQLQKCIQQNKKTVYQCSEKNSSGEPFQLSQIGIEPIELPGKTVLVAYLYEAPKQEKSTIDNELKIIKEVARSVAGMHRIDEILINTIARLYEKNYILGGGFYQVSKDWHYALLRFHFNIHNQLLHLLREIPTEHFAAVFQERQWIELPPNTLLSTQHDHLLLVPIVVENKVAYAFLFVLAPSSQQASLLLNLLGTEISYFVTHRQLASRLIQSENRFRILADNSPLLLRICDAEGHFTFFNQRWYKLVGIDRHQSLPWLEYLHPEDRMEIAATFEKKLASKNSFEITYRVRKFNGEYRWLLENAIPYFGSHNEFKGLVLYASDITDGKAYEQEIVRAQVPKYSRQSLQNTLQTVELLALTVEADGTISYSNDFLLKTTGWHAEELLGKALSEVLVLHHHDYAHLPFHQQLLSSFCGQLRCANGAHLHIRFHTITWNDAQGQAIAVTLIGEDISETLRAQQALEQSNALLKDLFDNATDLIQITDAEGNFVFVNKSWCNLLEYRPEEIRLLHLYQVVYPEDRALMNHLLYRAIAEGSVNNVEICFISRSGRKIHLRGSISYGHSFEEGKPPVYRAVFQDITEQMRAEKAQMLYHNLSRLTINSPNLETLYHNFYTELKKAIEVEGFLIALRNEKDQSIYFPYYINSPYAPDEGIQGRAFAEYAFAFERTMIFHQDMLRRIIQTNDLPAEEPLPQTWIGIPLKIDQKVIGIIVLQSYKERKTYHKRDLDLLNFISGQLATAIQRVQNQEKINEQNSRLQAIFESGQHLMWSVNKDLILTRFNGNYANTMRLLYNINITAGMSLAELYRQNDPEQVYFWLDKYKLALSGYPQQFERKMRGISGEEYWYEVFLSPIVTANSFEVDEVAGVAHNITVKKKAADELRMAKELAEHSLEVKKRFLSNMSHEIRTPMNGIIGMIDLLAEAENLEPEYRQYINTIKKSSETLLHILNDILDLSKIEAGKMELRKAPLSLVNMMDKLIALFQQRAMQKDIEFGYHIAAEVPPYIIADETRLLQILSNLTSNALKFTEKGSIKIQVEVAQPPDFLLEESQQEYLLKVKVIDTGIGIAPQHQELLFQKFSQLDNSYTKSHGGTGLGLAISQELCKLMQGDIGVESELGKGSTFWFTFRAKACKAEEVSVKESHALQQETLISGQIQNNPHILIVDDNSVNLNVARSILKRAGCQVSVARSGKEAIAMVQQQPFDLIFMDVQMPVMNGLETTRYIKELQLPHLPPIVAMTAFSMQEERETFLQAGMDDFIAKPIKAQALISKVKQLLDQPLESNANQPKEDKQEAPLPATQLPIVNPEVVEQMAKYGGREMIQETYLEFEQESRQLLENLALSISEQNFSQAKSILHTLKGNAGTLGIERLYAAAAHFEALLKQGQTSRSEEEFANLIRLFTEFQQHYKTYLQINA